MFSFSIFFLFSFFLFWCGCILSLRLTRLLRPLVISSYWLMNKRFVRLFERVSFSVFSFSMFFFFSFFLFWCGCILSLRLTRLLRLLIIPSYWLMNTRFVWLFEIVWDEQVIQVTSSKKTCGRYGLLLILQTPRHMHSAEEIFSWFSHNVLCPFGRYGWFSQPEIQTAQESCMWIGLLGIQTRQGT